MKYYQEIPVIRSIAAILVVSVHVIAGLYYVGGEFTNTSIGYINQLARIGTPIFAIISAFLLMSMVLRKGFDLRQFIQSRFSKIFVPYLIWSSVYLLYKYHVENSLNPDLSISSYFLYGNAHYHLYFILTVLQFYLVFPLLARFKKNSGLFVALGASMIINYLWLTFGNVTTDVEWINRFVNGRSFLLNWIAYFMMGITYAVYYQEFQDLLKRHRTSLLLVSGVILLDLWISIDLARLYTSTNISNLIYIPFVIVVLNYIFRRVRSDATAMKLFQAIGTHSMGIYLVHPLVIRLIRRSEWFEYFQSGSMFVLAMIMILSISMGISYAISLLPFGNYIIPVPKRRTSPRQPVDIQQVAS
ncbi:acyltransferase [Exiguobacterium undae]|uniref:acyltransferase n=1 Tax=Exiguobacterium undae TaxID=169177 RepID=UPI0038508047